MHIVEAKADTRPSLFLSADLAVLVEWLRILIVSVAFLFTVLFQVLEKGFIIPSLWNNLYFFFSISLILHFTFALTIERVEWRRNFARAVAGADLLLIAGSFATVGYTHSVFLLFFLANIVLAGLYLGWTSAFVTSLTSAAIFNFILAANPEFTGVHFNQTVVLYNGSFLLIGVVSGLLHTEFYRVGETLEAQKEDIRSLQDINQLIVDNIGSGLLVLDINGRISKANRAAAKILGDIGLSDKKIADVIPGLFDKLSSASRTEGSITRFEIGHLNYNGDKMVIETLVSPLIRRPYGYQGQIILLQNLTEVKNLEDSLRQQEKMAAIGAMAAGIAHEIRNPLASISGSIQLLASSLKSEAADDKKLAAIMVKEIDRLNRLVAEFLEFVKPPMKIDEPVNVTDLLQELLGVLKNNPQLSKSVRLEVDLKSKAEILGDYDKLKQAFLNIIMNAYQALEKQSDGHIKIETSESQGHVVVKVTDNGSGMSRETLSRMFVPFFTTKTKGTGLGLAITHKIFESHDAVLKVESELQHGTKFQIEFKQRRVS